MLRLLTLPFALVAKTFDILIHRGLYYCVTYFLSYGYLKIVHYFEKNRFDLYDIFAYDDPEKLAFFAPKEEWSLETPQLNISLNENSDDVSCFGVNSKSELLFVQLARKPNSKVHCTLLLQLSNGKIYCLPEEHVVQKETDEPHTFGSARLKMECLQPMRKWRVFFNGTLQEKSSDGVPAFKHVKFAFLSVSSSMPVDFNYETPLCSLAHAAAQQKNFVLRPISFIKKLRSIVNMYSQSGMLMGQIEVEGEESREVYLWGNRSRSMGCISDFENGRFREVHVNAENGTFLHLKTLNIPGVISEFHSGYVMGPNGYVFPISECSIESTEKGEEITCHFGELTYKFVVETETDGYCLPNRYNGETYVKILTGSMGDMELHGLLSVGTVMEKPMPTISDTTRFDFPVGIDVAQGLLCVPVHNPNCQAESLSGGKGSSLAKLCAFSNPCENGVAASKRKNFEVPRGVVVTTSAYAKFVTGPLKKLVDDFETSVWNDTSGDYSHKCERIKEEIIRAALPESISKSVERNLRSVFGNDFSELKFAVRSSATGEDTEQMSAAGQMATFLGVKEFDEILEALKKCWASQFDLVAVQYKRRYGQLLNTPMAVVIQEMVPCDIAGVLFTCDPVTGNPAYVTISANYGLGESVVAASAEPDTVKLERNIKNELKIHSHQVGSKKTKIVMTGATGVESIDLEENESSECCLKDEMALQLAKVAVEVEEHYGNPRDIEWGIHNNKLFLLQARPVTSISVETEFETKHNSDTYMRREDEYTTKANVGEVMCGSTSPMGNDTMATMSVLAFPRHKYMQDLLTQSASGEQYFPNGILITFGHVMFILSDAFFKFGDAKGKELTEFSKAMSVAMLGRVLDDEKLFKMATDRHENEKKQKMFLTNFLFPYMMFFSGYRNRQIAKKMEKVTIPYEKETSATRIFAVVARYYQEIESALISHLECTLSSSFWNLLMLSLLSKLRGAWDNEVFGDFAYLLSTCTQVESADVPSAMQHLGYVISQCIEPAIFKQMTTEEALQWLSSTKSNAGARFQEFLAKHGHRGIKEFDVYQKTWDMNHGLLVETLQGIVSEDLKDVKVRKHESVSHIISNLHVKPDFMSRLLLKFYLPNCQNGVRDREFSKSVLVKQFHKIRMVLRHLAKAMVSEGRLPHEDLLFFLHYEEVRQLLRTRSPKLVASALRRYKYYPEMDRMIFPEICVGVPKPINFDEDIPDDGSDLKMQGVPVSQGAVTARACVILSVKEATSIKSGDVLVTYATDIGWSPYFPLLSGVVTELGGLVSHGAVVAREYGLPCVVNLHGATKCFKTGDLVHLDGNKGTLRRIKSASETSQ